VSFLLDTCLVSELTKRRRDEGVIAWLDDQDEAELYLSVVTVGELEKGLAAQRDAARQRRLREFLEVEIVERFRDRIVPTDERAWRRWGALCGAAARRRRPLPVLDALIAAVAQVNGLTVVTRNETHFSQCEVAVLNPWTRR
jgi:predicted nucleic acid-binding protein